MDLVQVEGWKRFPWLRHGFSTRLGGVSTIYGEGSLNLGWTNEDDPLAVAENRRRLVHAVAAEDSASPLITLRQTHSAVSHVVRTHSEPFVTEQGRALLDGDGLITKLPGVLLGIQTADCVPVMVVDVEKRVVAVFHAGWRGTVRNIVGEGVLRMISEFGSDPGGLVAAVGPSIGACCYKVGEEVQRSFRTHFSGSERLFNDGYLDLWEANRLQLMRSGLASSNVTVIAECTGCAQTKTGARKYFSHRIDKGITGRMMSIVGVV
ncbi:peptidoglycan editing factor PgeF [Granulicella arctica]|uniref:peptidoglycan editing factor PgeF n=1 Tax=Granulicella arctica TaxID=940613 RepID=UPI0021E03E1F|nr:peptidoglycan editing factor PgeF [Granulicella arctica]